ncbi:MAG: hypothetical protein LBC69_00535 [Eubacteriaceae bacterium]|nr:hypothetical protein [Eubacteriaceae bacterium]
MAYAVWAAHGQITQADIEGCFFLHDGYKQQEICVAITISAFLSAEAS